MSMSKYEVKLIKNVLIPVRDGTKLTADIYMPDDEKSFPALLTYVPYHKDDFIGIRSGDEFRYFAERGYAQVLAEVRGTGGSEGYTASAFSPQEQRDGYDVVEWIARQPWCNGKVGMWGISYGGATSLLIAAQKPPHLSAIVPIYAPINWYLDVIYFGGVRNALSMFGYYGPFMLAMNRMPQSYMDPEGRWTEVWKYHLDNNYPWLLSWLEHPNYGPYWRDRSVHPERIEAPTFLIAGWRDPYAATMGRCYEEIEAPKRLLIGPWKHVRPHIGWAGSIDWLHEMLKWWDHWLKGIDGGFDGEPPVSIYTQVADEWRYEEEWPIPRTMETVYYLGSKTLRREMDGSDEEDSYDYNPIVGTNAGFFVSTFRGEIGLPVDQRPDEAMSLTYTSDTLKGDMEVTGSPIAILYVSSSSDEAIFTCKVCDVAPDGRSSLITSGWIDATHHTSHEKPTPLIPGEIYRLSIGMFGTSYLVKRGHRIRLDIASSNFPNAWPTGKRARNTLHRGKVHPSRLILPVITKMGAKPSAPTFLPPPPVRKGLEEKPFHRIIHDIVESKVRVEVGFKEAFSTDTGISVLLKENFTASVSANEPSDMSIRAVTYALTESPLHKVDIKTRSALTSDHVALSVDIKVDGVEYFSKVWIK